jgi:hypothetical protein
MYKVVIALIIPFKPDRSNDPKSKRSTTLNCFQSEVTQALTRYFISERSDGSNTIEIDDINYIRA